MVRLVTVIIAWAVALAALAGGLLYVDLRSFSDRDLTLPGGGTILQVAGGETIRSIARELARVEVLDRPPIYLEVLARWNGSASRIKAGEYRIPENTTPTDLLELLVSGKVIQYSLTIVEGWRFQDLLNRIRSDPVIEQTLQGMQGAQIMARLGRADLHPEGRFLPDTYRFPRGTTDLSFLLRALRAMDLALEQEWNRRQPDLPLSDPEQALILASIVEKETAVVEERGRIAGVFLRRLQRGMRLQTDPTVIYGLGGDFDGNLRRRDLLTDGPYNTYTRAGLPPTPIALPSRAAIHASLHPAPGSELYFVSKGDGSHYFSSTLSDHNAAVRRYQLRRK